MSSVSGKQRNDWSEQEDTTLAEIVLNHLRIGSTQLKAFEEASQRLITRSVAACGFRWNSTIRKKIKDQIENARKLNKANVNDKPVTLNGLSTSGDTDTKSVNKTEKRADKVTNLDIMEQLLAPDRVKELAEYMQALSANISLFQRMRGSLEEKDREINNLKETIEGMQIKSQRLEYLEEKWREFSTFAERVRLNG
ncbi:hypothetical protein [Paenibacillus periandrae]|uniref:hypothetical protein n=1 Tax=Paenibacillus periandrae TaxID=1761741 RepID=UPI001F095F39|nr:hypothetical protein [Paenibacillus periandrae]